MSTTRGVGLLAGVLTLIYGVYLIVIFLSLMAGFWHPTPSSLNPLVLAALDMVVYLFLGAQILRERREFFVLVVFWTIFGVALATFALSYRDSVLNLLSFLIVFSSTYYHVAMTKADVAVSKSLGSMAGILALVQGMYVGFLTVFTPLSVAAISAAVYLVSGVGMIRYKKGFFVLAILWTIVESALAVVNSYYLRSHFNLISILILAFATYYYFSKAKT